MTHQTNFKVPRSPKIDRFRKRMKAKAVEDDHKREVRRRDRGCRFPLCGCRKLQLRLEVSHQTHKGIGGNPKGERSTPDRMIQVCSARHKELRVSIDRRTLRWVVLDPARGSDGPVGWEINVKHIFLPLLPFTLPPEIEWWRVATEKAVGSWEPFTEDQRLILRWLGELES